MSSSLSSSSLISLPSSSSSLTMSTSFSLSSLASSQRFEVWRRDRPLCTLRCLRVICLVSEFGLSYDFGQYGHLHALSTAHSRLCADSFLREYAPAMHLLHLKVLKTTASVAFIF
ncbi:hypothetical protein PF011_g32948 [Phytophthora fragariae]|uniref:Uncharacterized protein n=1 Tax=Phytophthora fragariae TaxID=53985 RepID=A0A6A3G4D0_9STRA|nr:hypothetical protein PF011_g32948 [Phytophthora fragariae]